MTEEEKKRRKSEYNREYRKRNLDKLKAYQRQYMQENKERIAQYQRDWIAANRDKANAYNRERSAKIGEYIVSKRTACVDCGETHPAVLDFHHKDPSSKRFSVSHRNGASFRLLDEEIAKCEVLCSNCHRIRHWKEKRGA